MKKAVFLDRDGTINEDIGDLFLPDKLILIPRAIEALKLLQEQFELFIVTNQPGIGRGIFSEKEYLAFNEYYQEVLAKEGITIKMTYCCPHEKKEKCRCRKSSDYFLKDAETEFNICLEDSYVIGDHPHDIEMGIRGNAGTVYLLTGHGQKHKKEMVVNPDHIAENLYGAATWIIEKQKLKKGESGCLREMILKR